MPKIQLIPLGLCPTGILSLLSFMFIFSIIWVSFKHQVS